MSDLIGLLKISLPHLLKIHLPKTGVLGEDVLQNLLQYGLLYGRFAPTASKMDKEEEEGMHKKEYVKARVRDVLMNMNKDDDDEEED